MTYCYHKIIFNVQINYDKTSNAFWHLRGRLFQPFSIIIQSQKTTSRELNAELSFSHCCFINTMA